jgi:hypothetical protein
MRRQADPRLRFLASVGVAAVRPLTVEEEDALQERLRQLERLKSLLRSDHVDIDGVKLAMLHGGVDEAPTRFLSWQLVLGVKPPYKELWDFYTDHRCDSIGHGTLPQGSVTVVQKSLCQSCFAHSIVLNTPAACAKRTGSRCFCSLLNMRFYVFLPARCTS